MRLHVADQAPTSNITEPECTRAVTKKHSARTQQAVEDGNNLFRAEPRITPEVGEAGNQ